MSNSGVVEMRLQFGIRAWLLWHVCVSVNVHVHDSALYSLHYTAVSKRSGNALQQAHRFGAHRTCKFAHIRIRKRTQLTSDSSDSKFSVRPEFTGNPQALNERANSEHYNNNKKQHIKLQAHEWHSPEHQTTKKIEPTRFIEPRKPHRKM